MRSGRSFGMFAVDNSNFRAHGRRKDSSREDRKQAGAWSCSEKQREEKVHP